MIPDVEPEGLRFRLSHGSGDLPEEPVSIAAPVTAPLSDVETAALLSRLRPLPVAESAPPFFAPSDAVPPLTTHSIAPAFPPAADEAQPAVESGPLTVRRVIPEGEVAFADRVSITFSQPMVAIASHEEAAANVPVQMTPVVPGTWRWIGTQTLIFDAGSGQRFPMATSYRVTVPAGTRSATGDVLASDHSVTFQTSPVRLVSYLPTKDEPKPVQPVIRLRFDQPVDPAAVLPTITVRARTKRFPLRLATAEEIAADSAPDFGRDTPADHVVIATPVQPLRLGTRYTVHVGPAIPSLEGPRTSTEPEVIAFTTHSRLRLTTYHSGGWPRNYLWLEFNNPIDSVAFDPALVTVTPPIPNCKISVGDDWICIKGEVRGQVTYTVTVSGKLKDTFGRTLAKPISVPIAVKPEEAFVFGPRDQLLLCDPHAAPHLTLHSVKTPIVQANFYAVQESDWAEWLAYRASGFPREEKIPGQLISSHAVPTDDADGTGRSIQIPMSPLFVNGRGNVIAEWIQSTPEALGRKPVREAAWFQATDIGLTVVHDATNLYAWVTALKTGTPLAGAIVTLEGTDQAVTSDEHGIVRFPLGARPGRALIARYGEDTAFLPATFWHNAWNRWKREGPWLYRNWFVFDDRRLYRPGETVRIKGWLRLRRPKGNRDLTLPAKGKRESWRLVDSLGNEIAVGELIFNAWGGFDLTIPLPATTPDGKATLHLPKHHHEIQIANFRRPEFEMRVRSERAGPHVAGDASGIDVSAVATYYSGDGLAGTTVTWFVAQEGTTYQPSGHDGFMFATPESTWQDSRASSRRNAHSRRKLTGQTNSNGKHYLRIHCDTAQTARPYTLTATCLVQDLNRQTRSSSTAVIVHPSERYVGLRLRRRFIERGADISLDAIVCDIDGNSDPDRQIHFRAARQEKRHLDGKWTEQDADVAEWICLSQREAAKIEFKPAVGGEWTIRAEVFDDRGRAHRSAVTIWVAGADDVPGRQRSRLFQTATLIPDKKEYGIGDIASVLVISPFADAEGLAYYCTETIDRVERFSLRGTTGTLHIPIVDDYLTNCNLRVVLTGSSPRLDPDQTPRPDLPPMSGFATGETRLLVPPVSRSLTVTATPRETHLAPGATTEVTVRVLDADGSSVKNAEVAIVVVDEAILALADWKLKDPLEYFYPSNYGWLIAQPDSLYTYIQQEAFRAGRRGEAEDEEGTEGHPTDPGPLRMFSPNESEGTEEFIMADPYTNEDSEFGVLRDAIIGKAGDPSSLAEMIAIRSNFDALAAFVPSVKTDANGVASVPVTLPDNLTRYRVVAVAVAGARQIGFGEAAITARLPLMARPSPPRFLNCGDRFELPILIQNQTGEAMTTAVAVRGANLTFPQAQGQSVTVPAHDRVEVRFAAETVLPGTARFQVAAVGREYTDAAEQSLPVEIPATSEVFATYGEIDQGAIVQPVQAPTDALPDFGGLEITTSATAMQGLTDAFLYLLRYPYHCAEQIASRLLVTALLRDTHASFPASDMPGPGEIDAAMQRDLERLKWMQQKDGGFGFWSLQSKPYPFLGVHVAHALVTAQQNGSTVPPTMYERSVDYLQQIESKFASEYAAPCRRTIIAYALHVRHLAGDTDSTRARNLLKEDTLDNLGPDTVGWLTAVLAGDSKLSAARRWLNNRAIETSRSAHFTGANAGHDYRVLTSDRRTDAILLAALIADRPKSDLIPKVVRGLLDGRKQGHWSSTQDDAFVLVALNRYFRTFESATPDFVARLWLGSGLAGESRFQGRSMEQAETTIPMAHLKTAAAQNLTLAKEGQGRLYFRIGMRYAPRSLDLAPMNQGFLVHRVYEPIGQPSDVLREADGTWVVRAGAAVRVRVTMVTTMQRYHVALTDPLPAGFEAQDTGLGGNADFSRDTTPIDNSPYASVKSSRRWWEHENFRDERAEAFASSLQEGAYEYVYVCLATTLGTFVVPPAKAEEMYAPETFGRSATDRVRIE